MKKNLGGERVGSGNKMQIRLRHYERSTHNLSKQWKSSMGIGQLIPCTCTPALRGDKFDFNIAAGVRTVPSKGAMFGTYKLQLDYYLCPVRLYTGILHNNPVRIGLQMDKVLFPEMNIKLSVPNHDDNFVEMPFNTKSLLHYLGLSGLGCTNAAKDTIVSRNFQAIPVLAYYDIFKNYYSNKQEQMAYVLSQRGNTSNNKIEAIDVNSDILGESHIVTMPNNTMRQIFTFPNDFSDWDGAVVSIYCNTNEIESNGIYMQITENQSVVFDNNLDSAQNDGYIEDISIASSGNAIVLELSRSLLSNRNVIFYIRNYYNTEGMQTKVVPFELENIDKMRAELLSFHTMGAAYQINNFNKYPYAAVCTSDTSTYPNSSVNNLNRVALDGVMLKTYQSDMFNNWLATEFIDGSNGIANITKVKVEGGGFTIDTLNYAEKMYDLLNRIIVAGDTYEDWQDVVYEDLPKRHLESPMYLGGLSQEIIFEEIISTADTSAIDGGKGLGAIGGRGISRHRKGGHIRVKVDEASYIIGIISITPRIDYGQGNAFYFTDIKSMDDFHKPALDGIGFQDLIGERMAYFDTQLTNDPNTVIRHSIGKLPAWIEYMTAVDEVHGDFADAENENAFMVLNRNYHFDSGDGVIKDATTYIDPEKYNDCFLYTLRDSQNFWVQVNHTINARRKMSAKQIPNI